MSNRVPVSETVRDLGVIFDRCLTMSDQVAAVCRALATISCGSCARSYGRYRYMAPRQLSTPSLRVDLIIATPCFLVSTTVCSSDCSQSRMLPRALLPARGDVNTSRQYWGSYTGCRSVSASVTSWRCWCSEHYRARRQTTLLTTISSWPTLDGEPWGQLLLNDGSAWYHAATVRLVTDHLLLLVHVFGTTCQPNSATLNR